jgi:hypothetical protein
MSWFDPNPIKVSYIAVMTGWGSSGDWEFQLVENPRVIKLAYSVDTDACLHSRPTWQPSHTCTNAANICTHENDQWRQDMAECCPCTCNPCSCDASLCADPVVEEEEIAVQTPEGEIATLDCVDNDHCL